MGADFAAALAFVLAREGGYVNNPADPGGETKFGTSKRSHPDLDIANLTQEQAAAIYRRDYWDALRCGELSPPVALAVFDAGVNCGVRQAAIWLQRAHNELAGNGQGAWLRPDGDIGPVTLHAINAWCVGADAGSVHAWRLAWRICKLRLRRYGAIVAHDPSQARFLGGWINRVEALELAALEASGLHA